MGSGKDTAADYLLSKYPTGVKVAFSDPVYEILYFAQRRCGFDLHKDRAFLQFVGTDWGRRNDQNVWVNMLLTATKDETRHVFLSDLRFPNELRALKAHGWTCVKMVGRMDVRRVGTGSTAHVSESHIDTIPDTCWDFVVHNTGTLDMLYEQLDSIH